jgi:hypothetical protein
MSDKTSGRAGEAIEAEATPIDVPEVISGADRWLAEQRARVAEAAAEYVPHEITSAEDYRESKRARTQARKAIREVEDARRQQVGAIKDAVRGFEEQVRDLLAPLAGVDDAYRSALSEWERTCVDSRTQEVAAWYAETQGDVAAMVPFETVWARYAHQEKWDLYGANLVAIEGEVAEIAEHVIPRDLETIGGMGYKPQDAEALRAEYLRTLDLEGSCRRIQALREQRDRMAEAERARRGRMAEAGAGPATDAPEEPQEAPSAPERPLPRKPPTEAATEPQAAARRPVAAVAAPGRVMVFRVTVPEERAREFVAAMRGIPGVHGGPWHDEGTSE